MRHQQQVVEATIAAVAGRVPVLVGVLESSAERVVEAVQVRKQYAVDALVVTTPYYFQIDQRSIRWHYERVAAASPLPIVIYNIPQMTHNTITLETMQQLISIETIVGMKDSASDWAAFQAFLRLRDSRADFKIFQGNERISARALLMGADGIVPGLGNLIPRIFRQLYDGALQKNEVEGRAAQAKVDMLWGLHQHNYWLVCLKHAAALMQFGSGTCIGHSGELSAEAKQAIADRVALYMTPLG